MGKGDRASVQFKDPTGELSVVFYGRRAGDVLRHAAERFAREHVAQWRQVDPEGILPASRFEADVVSLYFLGWLHERRKSEMVTRLHDSTRTSMSQGEHYICEMHSNGTVKIVKCDTT